MECGTTGHKKLFFVESWGPDKETGWLCLSHFTNAYGPEPHFGSMTTCNMCHDTVKASTVDQYGYCEKCSEGARQMCFVPGCENTLSPEQAKTSSFCEECHHDLVHKVCTSCKHLLQSGDMIDMYGRCSTCQAGGEHSDFTICKGCQDPYHLDPVGVTITGICPTCVDRVANFKCTSCFLETHKCDEYGRCEFCSPDCRYDCQGAGCQNSKAAKLPYNKVSRPNTKCAVCQSESFRE